MWSPWVQGELSKERSNVKFVNKISNCLLEAYRGSVTLVYAWHNQEGFFPIPDLASSSSRPHKNTNLAVSWTCQIATRCTMFVLHPSSKLFFCFPSMSYDRLSFLPPKKNRMARNSQPRPGEWASPGRLLSSSVLERKKTHTCYQVALGTIEMKKRAPCVLFMYSTHQQHCICTALYLLWASDRDFPWKSR